MFKEITILFIFLELLLLAFGVYITIVAYENTTNPKVTIPKWISDLKLGYKFYLGHYTIHSEETILFAHI